jgi:hypothetical protein
MDLIITQALAQKIFEHIMRAPTGDTRLRDALEIAQAIQQLRPAPKQEEKTP